MGEDDCRVRKRTIRPTSLRLIIHSGGICCIGGPALIYYVTPTEEELFMVRL